MARPLRQTGRNVGVPEGPVPEIMWHRVGKNNNEEAPMANQFDVGALPHRPLGRTGAKVSALGLGGHHLGDLKTVDDAIRLVQEAVDAGITFYDNCWEYWNG